MKETEVVNLIRESRFNNHYWAMRLPYMNIISVPRDLKGYQRLTVEGFEDVGLYIKN